MKNTDWLGPFMEKVAAAGWFISVARGLGSASVTIIAGRATFITHGRNVADLKDPTENLFRQAIAAVGKAKAKAQR